jgi:glycosyltransferase involved in cell wall biosynthesis
MKKVLVLVYYWPPSGGAGVQRWLKFVKYLPENGWMPTVITTEHGDYPAVDHSLDADLPEGITIIRTKTPSINKILSKINPNLKMPYGSLDREKGSSLITKILYWCRINLIIPDMRVIWNRYAFKAAKMLLKREGFDLIVTSGPPHSTHLVGLKLKKKQKLPWLADFRDPWVDIDYMEKVNRLNLSRKIDKHLQSKVVNRADVFLSINKDIIKKTGKAEKSVLLPNGYDPDDFSGLDIQTTKEKFLISYFGALTPERDPSPILNALELINKRIEISKISIEFWGTVSRSLKGKLSKRDKYNIVSFCGYNPHENVVVRMKSSALLLLIINNVPNNSGIVTGKIYEYLGSGTPILAIGPSEGEAADILSKTKSGSCFDYHDLDGIADYIEDCFKKWEQNKEMRMSSDTEEYDKRSQTKRLAELMNRITKNKARP